MDVPSVSVKTACCLDNALPEGGTVLQVVSLSFHRTEGCPPQSVQLHCLCFTLGIQYLQLHMSLARDRR